MPPREADVRKRPMSSATPVSTRPPAGSGAAHRAARPPRPSRAGAPRAPGPTRRPARAPCASPCARRRRCARASGRRPPRRHQRPRQWTERRRQAAGARGTSRGRPRARGSARLHTVSYEIARVGGAGRRARTVRAELGLLLVPICIRPELAARVLARALGGLLLLLVRGRLAVEDEPLPELGGPAAAAVPAPAGAQVLAEPAARLAAAAAARAVCGGCGIGGHGGGEGRRRARHISLCLRPLSALCVMSALGVLGRRAASCSSTFWPD
jgi:hypothetical protein